MVLGRDGGGGAYTNIQVCRHSIRLTAQGESLSFVTSKVASDMSQNQGRLVH
jgi:hypothetical protein